MISLPDVNLSPEISKPAKLRLSWRNGRKHCMDLRQAPRGQEITSKPEAEKSVHKPTLLWPSKAVTKMYSHTDGNLGPAERTMVKLRELRNWKG